MPLQLDLQSYTHTGSDANSEKDSNQHKSESLTHQDSLYCYNSIHWNIWTMEAIAIIIEKATQISKTISLRNELLGSRQLQQQWTV